MILSLKKQNNIIDKEKLNILSQRQNKKKLILASF